MTHFPVVELDSTLDASWYDQKLTLQIVNVLAYFICLSMNFVYPLVAPNSLSFIADDIATAISPDGWAFSIWLYIYILIGVFVTYQALPSEWVPNRNDELIYYDIGYLFAVNMIINGVWLVVYQIYTEWSLIAGVPIIGWLLSTGLYILMKSTRTSVSVTEWIGLRAGFSIYTGWVTAATILNVTFMLKNQGFVDPTIPWVTEEQLAMGVLCVAFVIYNAASYIELNPLFGSIFVWVLLAIRSDIMKN